MSTRLCLLLGLLAIAGCGGEKDRIQPQRMDITEWVYASVIVQPDSLYKVYAAVNGILEEAYVGEGDSVARDQPLFQVQNTNPELNVQKLRLEYELSKEYLDEKDGVLKSLNDQISAARLRLQNDSVNYCRRANLWEQGIGSQAEYDARKLAYEVSRNELSRLESDYARTRKELQTRVKQAQLALRSSQVTSGDFVVKSQLDGKLYAVYKEKGELVTSMEPLASLGSASRFILELLVDEVDIVRVIPGQQVIVSLDAYPAKTFVARVQQILPDKDVRNQTFTVKATFNNQPEVLYPGLSGEANIGVRQRKDALVIPLSYLIDEEHVQTPKGIVEVRTGLRNLDFVEITQGLDEHAWLIKPN